ncbi:MAG: aminotransferase class V-fold PLP-dependent enzyme [Candidatus Firestonebacteria bacterium]|nr:aminotransferase class V-fold PLP-dependent enzyme [Candidatus Firestonebacteria bacterium]
MNYRDKFPILKQGKKIIYMDSACITLLPQSVLDSINKYYMEYSGCHGRGGHIFNEETTKRYEETRIKIQKFINAASPEEIIFTKNTTESINLVARTFPFLENDIVLTSDIEHNSNLLPWQELAKKGKIKHTVFNTDKDTVFNINKFKESMNENVKLVSILHLSNLTGVEFPISEIAEIVHNNKETHLMIDAAQSLCSLDIDVQKMGIDFLSSSLHKNFGPSGVGFLYARKPLLETLDNFLVGGETIINSTYTQSEFASLPHRFEAGLQNYAGIIAGGESINFIENIGKDNIHNHKIKLNKILSEKIENISGIKILGPHDAQKREGICNFLINGLDSFDTAKILSESQSIMIRAGFLCVHAWYNKNEIPPSLRVSLQIYNNEDEVLILAESIKKLSNYFR